MPLYHLSDPIALLFESQPLRNFIELIGAFSFHDEKHMSETEAPILIRPILLRCSSERQKMYHDKTW